MACDLKKLKTSFLAINVVCALCALAVICIAVDFIIYTSLIPNVDSKDFIDVAKVLVILGGILFLVSFIGGFGAHKESFYLVTGYSVCLICLLITHLYLVHTFYIQQNQDVRPAVMSFNEMFAQRNSSDSSMFGVLYIQDRFKCCGKESFEDWGKNVPETCKNGDKIFEEGCEAAIAEFIENQMSYVVNTAFFMGIILAVTTIATGCLAFSLRKQCYTTQPGKKFPKKNLLRTQSL